MFSFQDFCNPIGQLLLRIFLREFSEGRKYELQILSNIDVHERLDVCDVSQCRQFVRHASRGFWNAVRNPFPDGKGNRPAPAQQIKSSIVGRAQHELMRLESVESLGEDLRGNLRRVGAQQEDGVVLLEQPAVNRMHSRSETSCSL